MHKMLKTFHLLHYNLMTDFKTVDFNTGLNKTQHRVIVHLYLDGEQTMSSLCQQTKLQQGSMTSVIDSLEEFGYVQRTRKQTDRRKLFITLTHSGLQIANQMKVTMNQYLKEKLENLSQEEILEFEEVLDQLAKINEKLLHAKGGRLCKKMNNESMNLDMKK